MFWIALCVFAGLTVSTAGAGERMKHQRLMILTPIGVGPTDDYDVRWSEYYLVESNRKKPFTEDVFKPKDYTIDTYAAIQEIRSLGYRVTYMNHVGYLLSATALVD
jgi:hypothetical protein